MEAAERECQPARYVVGLHFELGKVVAQNLAEAAKWYKLASAQPQANYRLGRLLFRGGPGIPKDDKAAYRHFCTASYHGHTMGRFYTTYCSLHGRGTQKNVDSAIDQLKDAAGHDPRSACELGMCFMNGTGVRQDSVEALKWLGQAAEAGLRKAQFQLAEHYINNGSSEQALKYYAAAAAQGHRHSQEMTDLLREALKSQESQNHG
jgi:TPR repeat protein